MARDDLTKAVEPITRAVAFRRLADARLLPSYRLARAILGERAEAEDATHDAFLTAWRKWPSLRDVTRFEPWFDRILINTCRNRLRSRRRVVVRDLSDELQVLGGEPFGATHDRDALGRALRELSPDHRLVVVLRFYTDLSIEVIAERVGAPSGPVRSRLHYALERLHASLEPERGGRRP